VNRDHVGGFLLGLGMIVLGGLLLKYRRWTYPFLHHRRRLNGPDIPRQYLFSFYVSIAFLILVGGYACLESLFGSS